MSTFGMTSLAIRDAGPAFRMTGLAIRDDGRAFRMTGWPRGSLGGNDRASGAVGHRPIIVLMGAFTCCGATVFKALSRAAAKSASARLRQIGMGSTHPDWAIRAEICESCPLRVVRHNVSYCGDPFLEKVVREPTTEGCGCPTKAKAKSPDEHCPLDRRHLTAVQIGGHCTCKWCQALV